MGMCGEPHDQHLHTSYTAYTSRCGELCLQHPVPIPYTPDTPENERENETDKQTDRQKYKQAESNRNKTLAKAKSKANVRMKETKYGNLEKTRKDDKERREGIDEIREDYINKKKRNIWKEKIKRKTKKVQIKQTRKEIKRKEKVKCKDTKVRLRIKKDRDGWEAMNKKELEKGG